MFLRRSFFFVFFFNDTATTEIYTLSLHDALPIAVHGPLRVLLPVPQERLTAIGYYASGDGALPLSPLGSEANQGFMSRTIHSVFGGGATNGLRYYELGGGSGQANAGLAVG